MKSKPPKPIVVIKTIVSIGLLAFIFTHIDLNKAWVQVQNFSLQFILFALIYYTGCQCLSCLRWQIVLRSMGYFVSIPSLLSSYFSGMFVNIFLPGSFGGDVYRVYQTAKKIKDPEVAIASVLLERFTGLTALFSLALLGLPAALKIIGSWDIILIFLFCSGAIAGGVMLIASPKLLMWFSPWLEKLRLGGIATRFAKIQISFVKFTQYRQALALAMVISLILQLAIVYYLYLLAQQLRISLSYQELLVFTPISAVVTLLPISLGGLGIQEGLWAYLCSRVGVSPEEGVLLSLSFTIFGWILSLPGGIIILLDLTRLERIKKGKID